MSEFWTTLIRYVLIGVVSYAAGSITAYRRAKVAGIPLVVPFIPKSSRNFTIVVLTLALLTTFSVVSGQLQDARFRACQVQFQNALKANTSIAAEDRELEKQDDALNDHRDELTEQFWKDLLANTEGQERGRAIAEVYNANVEANSAARDSLTARRAQLEADRLAHPYPEPSCE